MHCLRCEVARAKVYSRGLSFVGKTYPEIVERLNQHFGGKYYLDHGDIMRENTPINILILPKP